MERRILVEAAAWFGRETEQGSRKSTCSCERTRLCFLVATLCRVVEVATGGHYGWMNRERLGHVKRDAELAAKIKTSQDRSRRT